MGNSVRMVTDYFDESLDYAASTPTAKRMFLKYFPHQSLNPEGLNQA